MNGYFEESNYLKPEDYDGFQLVEMPGEYILEVLGEPQKMPWGAYQIHFKAKTPGYYPKLVDDNGTTHETLYAELIRFDRIKNISDKAKCSVDYFTDLTSGEKILGIVGIDSWD